MLFFSLTAFGATKTILVVGDSLTEGYGVAQEESFPSQLESLLKKNGFAHYTVKNAGISGATAASGLNTLKFHIKHQKPDIIILALGSNDGLRGIDPEVTKANLKKAILKAKEHKIPLILSGLKAPPNYGRQYPEKFEQVFTDLAQQFKLPLIPFLLEGVAGVPELNLPDGIHPNVKGYAKVSENVFKILKGLLK